MNLLDIVVYFAACVVASAINSVAGGGTFLVFPLLILNGISAFDANILCTVSLWLGSVASALGYKGEHTVPPKELKSLIVISVLGSVLGAITLLLTPEQTFSRMVPWLLLMATLIFAFGRRVMQRFQWATIAHPSAKRAVGLQFIIAVYGGYFGAGIGILMLAMLQLIGFSRIHQMNAIKTILASAVNAAAVLIFIFSGKILWSIAFIMTAGAVVGGYFGARLARKVSPDKIRLLVSAIGFAMSAYFFLYGV